MPLPRGKRVYIDTMVWVYHLAHRQHPEYAKCKMLLDQISRGEIAAVSSTFVIAEIVSAARKVITETRGTPLSVADLQNLRAAVLTEMGNYGVDIRDADSLAAQPSPQGGMFGRVSTLVQDCGGSFTYVKGQRRWKGLGGADAIHLALAERSNADILATCDSDFKHSTSLVAPAVVREVYP